MNALRQQFADDFSASAFRVIDGEPRIVGKYGQITQDSKGAYDAWFIGPNLAPLSTRRLTAIAQNFTEEGGFRTLTGEGWVKGRGRAFVLKCARLAGVRKKRKTTPEQHAKLAERLQAAREAARP